MGAAGLGPRINVSCQAVVQILLVIGIGAWLSARRGLDRQALAAVSLVNWHALIPALMVRVSCSCEKGESCICPSLPTLLAAADSLTCARHAVLC